jgi:hypothetical protein
MTNTTSIVAAIVALGGAMFASAVAGQGTGYHVALAIAAW